MNFQRHSRFTVRRNYELALTLTWQQEQNVTFSKLGNVELAVALLQQAETRCIHSQAISPLTNDQIPNSHAGGLLNVVTNIAPACQGCHTITFDNGNGFSNYAPLGAKLNANTSYT